MSKFRLRRSEDGVQSKELRGFISDFNRSALIDRVTETIDIELFCDETDHRMPHRKLVRIGETPVLPTISQFLKEMAARQHEEIERLKTEALSGKLPNPTVPESDHDSLTPDPWLLHPVRAKRAAKKAPRKKSSKPSVRAKSVKAKKKSLPRPRVAKKVASKKPLRRKKK